MTKGWSKAAKSFNTIRQVCQTPEPNLPNSFPGSESSRNFAPLWVVLLFTVGLAFPERVSEAQTKYPNKAVRIVLPFAAGGGGARTARLVGGELWGEFWWG